MHDSPARYDLRFKYSFSMSWNADISLSWPSSATACASMNCSADLAASISAFVITRGGRFGSHAGARGTTRYCRELEDPRWCGRGVGPGRVGSSSSVRPRLLPAVLLVLETPSKGADAGTLPDASAANGACIRPWILSCCQLRFECATHLQLIRLMPATLPRSRHRVGQLKHAALLHISSFPRTTGLFDDYWG